MFWQNTDFTLVAQEESWRNDPAVRALISRVYGFLNPIRIPKYHLSGAERNYWYSMNRATSYYLNGFRLMTSLMTF